MEKGFFHHERGYRQVKVAKIKARYPYPEETQA
jgi:hypothetical protein